MALENVITSLVLDVIDHDQTQGIVKAIALDSKTRYVKATIVQHGIDYPVDENATVTLTILRPDNVGVQVTGSVVDVDNADRTGTIKGVMSELTQAALAKSGNLKAQFKMVVGQQILRTEIFAVKNGIALDGETNTWASEYDGYNLDEVVESVNIAVSTVEGLEGDVDILRDDLSATFVDSSAAGASTLTIGKYRSLENNTLTTDPACAYGGSLTTATRKAGTFTDDDYLFAFNAYTELPVSSTTMIKGLGWYNANTVVTFPSNAGVVIGQVKRKDGNAIDESERETIKAAFKFFLPTDESLSIQWKPADSKAVGDKFAKLASVDGDFYVSNDDVSLVSTAAEVFALFDALVTAHSDYVTKNTLTTGTFSNYEYVFSTGNYNSKNGQRSQDAAITKPTVLITAGIHGYERSAVMSLYGLCKALCENDYRLADVINFVTLRVIPIVCPWGYTNNSRVNENSVNINRNFDSDNWTQTNPGSDFSGLAPADQNETKVVQNWLNAHPCVLYLDWHNSNFTDEISCLLGNGTDTKKKYLLAVNEVIPYWQKVREIGSANIYGYTGTSSTTGTASAYARDNDINGFTFETSWNVIESGKHSNFSIGTGAEAMASVLNGMKSLYTT